MIAAIKHTARCAQYTSHIRDPLLILSLLRYLHEQEMGQIEQNQASRESNDRGSAARSTSIDRKTTGGEIYSLFIPRPLLCDDCSAELKHSLRITVISVCRLIEKGQYDAFEEQLERCCPR